MLVAGALLRARRRQLLSRIAEPVARRRFPDEPRPRNPVPLVAGRDLWRSGAFAGADEVAGHGAVALLGKSFPFPPADWSLPGETRLRRFHLHYGDEVLGWARRDDAGAAAEAVTTWIGGNPPRAGDAWHPYPLSTRVLNWLAAAALEPSLLSPMADSLWHQLAYLRRNVEHGVLGNHVVRNATALLLGGAAFGDDALSSSGMRVLRREVAEQVLPDGGHYERSPVYHMVVLRDLLQARLAPGTDWLDEPIARMRRFAASLMRPDGRPFPFNDAPFELAPALELPAPPPGLVVFPETGYAVLRTPGVVLAFDCGPPSPTFLPAHAHADGLSIQLWVDGLEVVPDAGTFTYEAGRDRDLFRGTAVHSTVMLDGRDQFRCWGAFRSGPLPRVSLRGTEPLSAELRARRLRHRRTLSLDDRVLRIVDRIEGRGEHDVVSTLPLGSDAWLERATFAGSLETRVATVPHSERMENRDLRPALVAEGRVSLPVELEWRLDIGGAC